MGGVASPGGAAQPAACSVRTPLWKDAYRSGIVYGTALATWQQGRGFRGVVNREAAVLFTQDDLLWYVVKPTPDSELDFSYADSRFDLPERHGQLVCAAHLV